MSLPPEHETASTESQQRDVPRVVAAAGIVFATVGLVVGLLLVGVTEKYAANRDFIEYWAAGQQLAKGANPYDAEAILRLERGAGMESTDPQVSLSPPVPFCFLLPLGFLSARSGMILWMLGLMAALLGSVWLLWILNGRPTSGFHFAGYLFPPAIACLLLGQIGTFLLLAIALFLFFHDRHPLIAGVVLLPCAWKPHLFLPFFLVLVVWSVVQNKLQIWLGFLAAVGTSCAITQYFDPHIWQHYSDMLRATAGKLGGYVPTLSVTLRFLLMPHLLWTQYLPEALACGWALWYFWTRRQCWDWMEQGSWVLLVSCIATPYAWFTDEAILLPAILFGVYKAAKSGRSLLPIAVVGFLALIEVSAFGHIASTHYLWTTPAWLAWYIYATWGKTRDGNAAVPSL